MKLRLAVVVTTVVTACVSLAGAQTAPATAPAPATQPSIDDLKRDLATGDSKVRFKAILALTRDVERLKSMDDSLLDAFAEAAKDPEPRVRRSIATTVGSRWVWRHPLPEPAVFQKAVALEMRLAADDPDREVRSNAIYHALSTVPDKSDDVIAAMIKGGMRDETYEPNLHGRIEWGLRGRGIAPERLAKHVEPYLAAAETDLPRALIAYMIFVNVTGAEPPSAQRVDKAGPFVFMFQVAAPLGEDPPAVLKAFNAAVPAEQVTTVALAPYRGSCAGYVVVPNVAARRVVLAKLAALKGFTADQEVHLATPEMVDRLKQASTAPPRRPPAPPPPVLKPDEDYKKALIDGDSQRRLAVFEHMERVRIMTHEDESALDAFEACAADPSPRVRDQVARRLGGWIWNKQPQNPRAIALATKLSADADESVVHDAVYFGLSTVKNKGDDVIRACLAAAMANEKYDDINLHGRIAWGFREETPQRLAPFFEQHLKDPNLDRAVNAYALFVQSTAHEPPDAERFKDHRKFVLWFGQTRDKRLNDAASMIKAFRVHAPEALVPEVAVYPSGDWLHGAAVFSDLRLFREVVAKLKDDFDLSVEERPFLLLPRRLAYLRTSIAKDPARTISTIAAPAMTYEEVFRDLHTHLGQVYPAFAMKKIDWKKVGDELIPKAKDVKNVNDFGLLCLQLVARLEDSHAQLVPGTAEIPKLEFPRFDPGFACLIDDRDQRVVYHVDKDSPADKAGVKVGMTVVTVNGKPAADAMKAWMDRARTYVGYSSDRYLRYDAAKGFHRAMKQAEVVKVEMTDVAGAKHAFEMPATLDSRYVPRLPVPIDGIRDDGGVMAKRLGDGIGYIYVRRIRADLPETLDAALRQLGEVKGLIIDVRGNSGGAFNTARAFRNFDPADTEEPDRPRYAGPIALLIDERCISAGEGWASWFFANKRARAFGTATAGASSRKSEYVLTNGLYKVIVPVKAYTGSLDRPIERRGLEPDVPVRVTAADLAAGKDTVLETVKQWLREAREK